MAVLRNIDRKLALLACMILVATACARTVEETAAAATLTRPSIVDADTSPPGSERYPADVYRPSDYVVRSVTETGQVLTISGDAPGSAAVLFAQARATMPIQGWKEMGVEEYMEARSLAFEKSGYEARLTFIPNGDATQLRMQLRSPGSGAQPGMD